jgi:hypothetical protein
VTTPFVNELRNSGELLTVGAPSGNVLHLRVQVAALWDSIRVDASADTPVIQVKRAALDTLYPQGMDPDEYVVRLHGFEILDENASLSAAGVRNGSILLLVNRRRQPVK